ncbi:MAG: lysophospholipase [Clostridiales Family XIII bacterium]|jgi:alpha-beta hydrolase superfamily lysophospholipase|nr:lysophospholipase [Clostridiales Family XIII bacterium]
MFETFQLRSCDCDLAGYIWEAAETKAVACMVHGLGEYAGNYARLGTILNLKQITLIGFDLRGHGLSPGKRGDIGDRDIVKKDVDSVLSYAGERYGSAPIVLCGQSMGGNIVLDYRRTGELSGRLAGYIATAPWIELCDPMDAAVRLAIRALAWFRPDAQLRAKHFRMVDGQKVLIGEPREGSPAHNRISARTLSDSDTVARMLTKGKLKDRFGGGGKPLIVMQGTGDITCTLGGAQRLADAEGANCELIIWDGYGHNLFNGKPGSSGLEVIRKMWECVLRLADAHSPE